MIRVKVGLPDDLWDHRVLGFINDVTEYFGSDVAEYFSVEPITSVDAAKSKLDMN